jgi:ABC-type dipeptide/oligopeptide/nickel transport system permease subunit
LALPSPYRQKFRVFSWKATPSWGWDLKSNLLLVEINPWITLFPGLAIFLTVLAFNLFGDGLRDVLDPRLKE